MSNSSLVVVGSGIKFISHLTHEAKVHIEQADKVLFLLNDPAMKEWVQKANPKSESLDELYTKYPLRIDCYHAITSYILETLRLGLHVCAVFYGHPSMLAIPGLNAVLQAKKEGIYARILPGISAEACLFADLLINPGSCGWQSFETTDFLINSRKHDPNCHLILWQADVIGTLTNPTSHDNCNGLTILVDRLSKFYQADHNIILYEAAQYPFFEPKIQQLLLRQLPSITLSSITTLYVPPANQTKPDTNLLKRLNNQINLSEQIPCQII